MKKIIILTLLIVLNLSAFSLFSSNEEALKKVAYMQEMKNLIVSTQKTRGLTNSYMNGNTVAMLQVHAERKEMKRAFAKLEKLSAVDSNVLKLKNDLYKLNKKAFKKKANDVFSSYTKNIDQMLLISKNFVDTNFKKSSELTQQASTMMMSKILPFTENIGKIRGMGSGIVARKHSTKDEDKQMSSFVDSVEDLSQAEAPNMKILARHYPKLYSDDIGKDVDNIDSKVKKYMRLTRNSVIASKNIELSANEYFTEGTSLISQALVLFDANVEAIKKDLN